MDELEMVPYVPANERELLLLSYLIGRPEIMRSWGDRIAEKHFEYLPARIMFSILNDAITRNGEPPTALEMRILIESSAEAVQIPSIIANQLSRDACLIYEQPVTDATGIDLSDWLMSRELQELGGKLLTMEPGRASDALPDIRIQLDKLQSLGGASQEAGMSLFSYDTLENLAEIDQELLGIPIPTGFPKLDMLLQGGFRRGEFGLIGGITGGGKSQMLINIGIGAMLHGLRVLYIALDNLEGEMAQRIWAATGRQVLSDKASWSKTDWNVYRDNLKSRVGGSHERFILKGFAPYRLTPRDLQRYIQYEKDRCRRIDLAMGVHPDFAGDIHVLMVDYLDQMLPNNKTSGKRHEDLQGLSVELLAIAREENLAALSVFQINREGMDMATPRLTHMADAIGKVHCASHAWILCQTQAEELQGVARFVNFKTRRMEKFYVIPMLVDTMTQEIREDPDGELGRLEDAPTGKRSNGRRVNPEPGEEVAPASRAQNKFERYFGAQGT